MQNLLSKKTCLYQNNCSIFKNVYVKINIFVYVIKLSRISCKIVAI